MSLLKFASLEEALDEIARVRQAGRLQGAIGLARQAIVQFPDSSELHVHISELYLQTHQYIHARTEKLRANQLSDRLAERAARAPLEQDFPDAPPAPAPALALLAALLPGSAMATEPPGLPAVSPQYHQELLQLLDPLVVDLVQMEAALGDGARIPARTGELIGECRQELRDSQHELHQSITAGAPRARSTTTFTDNLAPVGQTYFTQYSSHGPEVLALQKILNREKISVAYSSVYDLATQKAVYALQERYGVSRTGVVDAETRELLDRLIAKHGLGGGARSGGGS